MDAGADRPARAWSYDELLREAVALIPAYAPEWTNHNPSDPGITLVELLAYLAEILAYRALRVTPDAQWNFLRLLEGSAGAEAASLVGAPAADVEAAVRARVQALARPSCAVTAADFERLACEAAARHLGEGVAVRAACLVGWDLRRARAGGSAPVEAPADVSIVVAPERPLADEAIDRLCREVEEALVAHCPLTTRAHVIGPAYLEVRVGCRVALAPGATLAVAVEAIDEALRRGYGPPLSGEPPAPARGFGQPLHLGELARTIDLAEGVDYVEDIAVRRIDARAVPRDDADSRVGLRIGLVARPGEDARLGGRVSVARRRLQVDAATGEAEVVLPQPWELVRVRLAREAVTEIVGPATGEDDASGAGTAGARDGR